MSRKLPGLQRTRAPGAAEPPAADETPPPGGTPRARRRTAARRSEAASGQADGPGAGTVAVTGEILDKEVVTPVERAEAVARRRAAAESIIGKYAAWSSAGGLIPVPLVDIAAVSAAQLRMLIDLAELHRVPFARDSGKAVLASVAGGVAPYAISAGAVRLLFKAVPGVGTVAGAVGMAGFSHVSTRILGRLFARHFEAGGKLDKDGIEALRLGYAEAMAGNGRAA